MSPWHTYYQKRWAWIIDSLATVDFPRELQNSRRADAPFSAILYGNTQVGKTSLLLELIGVAPEHQEEVETVFKANQRLGQSRTSFPVRYSWNKTNVWSLRDQENVVEGCELITKFFDSRRGSLQPNSDFRNIVEVGIPISYRKSSSTFPLISLLDLPGKNASTSSEAEWVEKMLEYFENQTQTVILVTTAYRLSFKDFYSKAIDDPQKFRVVLTHSYSDERVKGIVLADQTLRNTDYVEQVDSHFRQELDSSHISPKVPVFIVEMADSWSKLESFQKPYFDRISSTNSHYLQSLIRSLDPALLEESYYLNIFNYRKLVENHFQKSINLLESSIRLKEEKIKELKLELLKSGNLIKTKEKKIAEINAEIGLITRVNKLDYPKIAKRFQASKLVPFANGANTDSDIRNNVDEIVQFLRLEHQYVWREWFAQLPEELKEVVNNFHDPLYAKREINDFIIRNFTCCMKCKKKAWFEFFSKDIEVCLEMQINGVKNSKQFFNGLLEKQLIKIRERVNEQSDNLRDEKKSLQRQVARITKSFQDTNRVIDQLVAGNAHLEMQKLTIEVERINSIGSLDGIENIINQNFKKQIADQNQKMGTAENNEKIALVALTTLMLRSWSNFNMQRKKEIQNGDN